MGRELGTEMEVGIGMGWGGNEDWEGDTPLGGSPMQMEEKKRDSPAPNK
jgi:hypothetical protein